MMSFVSGKKGRSAALLAISCALVLLAAFLTCSLLFRVVSPADSARAAFAAAGNFLYSAYGITSFLIPAFLLACAISLILKGAGFSLYFLLLASVIPFFTAFGGEKLIRSVIASSGSSFLSRIIFFGLFISILLAVITEYLVLFQLSRYAKKKLFSGRRNPKSPAKGRPANPDALQEGSPADSGALQEGKAPAAAEDLPVVSLQAHKEDAAAEPPEAEAASPGDFEGEAENALKPALHEEECPEEPLNAESLNEEPPKAESVNDELQEEAEEEGEFISSESFLQVIASAESSQDCAEEGIFVAIPYSHVGNDGEGSLGGRPLDGEAEAHPDAAAGMPLAEEGQLSGFLSSFGAGVTALDDRSLMEEIDAQAERLAPDIEFNPAMFAGYIAGNFSVIDCKESENDSACIDTALSAGDSAEDSAACANNVANSIEESARGEALPSDAQPESPLVAESPAEGAESISAALPAPPAQAAARAGRPKYSIGFEPLNTYPDGEYWVIGEDTREAASILKDTLSEFNIQAEVTGIRKGPVITMFEILPAPGVRLSRIVGLQDNIALRLAASSIRIVAPIPGKHAVGIEVPNSKRCIVSFRELIETESPALRKMDIPVMLGKDIAGEAQIIDLASTPHLLIAGSTGSGKSVCVNSIILSILYKKAPDEVKLLLIDPKVVELKLYNDIGHLLTPVITEPKRAFQALQYCLCEMERRYSMLDSMGVRNIREYNRRIGERAMAAERLPYIVVLIDEFADLMATTGKELESAVARLAAMSRAVGIHLVLATQRPSIDVITGLIKANIPSRIAFMVASKIDSRIIIDQVGAEKLLGKGDMLYSSITDPFPVRIQGAFVSDEEVERVVEQVKAFGEPDYIDDEIFVDDDGDDSLDAAFLADGEDPLYNKALDIVLSAGKASASYIQRRLKTGYNRAARLVEEMEARGIVGPANGSKPREVIRMPDRHG